MEETKDKKNDVEAYVYDMLNKLHGTAEPDREAFISRLKGVEDWLYEDGEDETKGVYITKLEELKKLVYFLKNLMVTKSMWRHRNELKVEDACIAALFGLECPEWFCAGEIIGRGFTSIGYYPEKTT